MIDLTKTIIGRKYELVGIFPSKDDADFYIEANDYTSRYSEFFEITFEASKDIGNCWCLWMRIEV